MINNIIIINIIIINILSFALLFIVNVFFFFLLLLFNDYNDTSLIYFVFIKWTKFSGNQNCTIYNLHLLLVCLLQCDWKFMGRLCIKIVTFVNHTPSLQVIWFSLQLFVSAYWSSLLVHVTSVVFCCYIKLALYTIPQPRKVFTAKGKAGELHSLDTLDSSDISWNIWQSQTTQSTEKNCIKHMTNRWSDLRFCLFGIFCNKIYKIVFLWICLAPAQETVLERKFFF